MGWQNQQPPWGKRPPTPEEAIAAILRKIKDAFGNGKKTGGGSGGVTADGLNRLQGDAGRISAAVVAVVCLIVLFNSFYTVSPGGVGIVLRFGRYAKTTMPGLNFKLPLVEEVIKVDMEKVRKEEFGFRTKTPGEKTVYESKGYDIESLMLTGDKNVIDVEWIVQYKVKNPVDFLFRVKNVRQAVRDVSETVIQRIIGNLDFDHVLGNREVLAANTQKEMQSMLDRLGSGVKIVTVQLQDINPPTPVKPAFNEVNEADQDMKRLVNEAEETYNRLVPKARGDAKKIVEEALGYAVARLNKAKGESERFLNILEEYRGAKEVTRRRMYLETLQEALPRVREIYVMDKDRGGGVVPYLNLRETKQPAEKK